jgi:hypothetical protein
MAEAMAPRLVKLIEAARAAVIATMRPLQQSGTPLVS